MNVVVISALFLIKASHSAVIETVSNVGPEPEDKLCQLREVILRNEETVLEMSQQLATLKVWNMSGLVGHICYYIIATSYDPLTEGIIFPNHQPGMYTNI